MERANSLKGEPSSIKPPTMKTGWMTKQGRKGLVKNWKKRYFVLTSGKLSYFVESAETMPYGEGLKGELNLVNTEVQDPGQNQIYVVSYNGESNLLMQTDSAEDQELWVKSLKEHIKYANAQTTEKVARASMRPNAQQLEQLKKERGDERLSSASSVDDAETNPTTPLATRKPFGAADTSSSATASANKDKPASTTTSTTATTSKTSSTSSTTTSTSKANRESLTEAATNVFNRIMEIVMDGDARSNFISELVSNSMSALSGVKDNLSAGNAGERGEKLIFAAAVSFGLLVFTNNGPIMRLLDFFLTICSTVLIAVGMAMVLNSVYELKDNMSVFLVPATKGKIVDTGLYSKARHPMYGGLILFAFGWSFLSLHPHKIVFTLLLAVILDRAAETEEDMLEKQYPKEYPLYASDKKVLVPFIY